MPIARVANLDVESIRRRRCSPTAMTPPSGVNFTAFDSTLLST